MCERALICKDVCYTCKYAIREEIYKDVKRLGLDISNCKMYEITEDEKYSDIEKAILQVLRCESCTEYYRKVIEIKKIVNSIPYCFKSMNDVPNGHISKISYEIDEILNNSKQCTCKEKIVLCRIINEFIRSGINEKDYEKIYECLKNNNVFLNFYIHPITIKYVMDKIGGF